MTVHPSVNTFGTFWTFLLNWATFSGHTGVAECDKTNLRRGGELVEDVVVPLLGRLGRDPGLFEQVVLDEAALDLELGVEADLGSTP